MNYKFLTLFKVMTIMGVLVTVLGCSSTVTQTYTPAGRLGYIANCDNFVNGGQLDQCLALAGKTCGENGYQIVHSGVNALLFECRSKDTNLEPALIEN